MSINSISSQHPYQYTPVKPRKETSETEYWCGLDTHLRNYRLKESKGKIICPEVDFIGKTTKEQIKKEFKEGMEIVDIADKYGLSHMTVCCILTEGKHIDYNI